ncbi:MAG: translation initiation factor IF-3 [Nitrospirae bacterium]|nr:translation initiation factor IF-3 [Nitrospirota bacterium]
MNARIKAVEVRVIEHDGSQSGIMPVKEALKLAEEKGLDLVEVAPQASPPVCRVMDYGKYRYEQRKRTKEAKKKQKITEIKEIKLRPKIEEHDYQVKLRQAQRFLKSGDKTKVTIVFRGREMAHLDIGKKLLDRFAGDMTDLGVVEVAARMEGRSMGMILAPHKQ